MARGEGNLVRGGAHLRLYRRRVQRARGGRPGRRSAADRADLRAGRNHRSGRADSPCRRAVDLDRAAESVSGTAARWRPPFVLCGGSRAGPSTFGAGAGDGMPDRARLSADVDGVCPLQRHSAPGGILIRLFCDVAHWQRLGMKMESRCPLSFAAPAKLATSRQQVGNLPDPGGVGRHRNDKGASRMKVGMRVRGGLLAALIMFAVPVAATLVAFVPSKAAAQTASSIVVEGNRRVEVETILSYFRPGPGGHLGQAQIDDGLKALIETGLFQDVRIGQQGGRIVVTVVENPVIGRIAFEGNKKVKDEQLSTEIQSKPRGTLSRPMVQSDDQRIAEIYRRTGRYSVRVVPEIIEQPNNRVDLVFTITEGSKTGVRSIEFIGNNAYSSYRLRDIIKTRESNLLSFLGGGDVYDPDRVEADRDLIRRYYLKHGFADVQVVAAQPEQHPDSSGFQVTCKLD